MALATINDHCLETFFHFGLQSGDIFLSLSSLIHVLLPEEYLRRYSDMAYAEKSESFVFSSFHFIC